MVSKNQLCRNYYHYRDYISNEILTFFVCFFFNEPKEAQAIRCFEIHEILIKVFYTLIIKKYVTV